MPPSNALVKGTALEALGHVPGWADDLWARVHRREGEATLASAAFVRRFGEALDRLGLAEVARAEVARHADAGPEAGARRLALRYHLIALIEHAARAVLAIRPLDDAREVLRARRTAVARIERLAADAAHPGGPFERPPPGAEIPELTPEGVGPPAPARRELMPVGELALALVADVALILEDVARAAIARINREGPPPFDLHLG